MASLDLSALSAADKAAISRALTTGNTGELSPKQLSIFSEVCTGTRSTDSSSIFKESNSQLSIGLGVSIERTTFPKAAQPNFTPLQESDRDSVAQELGISAEDLQKYVDVGGQKLGNNKNGITLEDEKKGYYKTLAKEINDCPFKGTNAYLDPQKYIDSINPTDLENQPNCGIGAGQYLKEHSENEWVKNLSLEQRTALAMLLQPDVQKNQEAGKLDDFGCGVKDSTTPWVFLGMDSIMHSGPSSSSDDHKGVEEPNLPKDPVGTPEYALSDFNQNGTNSSLDWEIGYLGKDRDGRIGVPLGTVDSTGRTDYNSLLPWLADRNTTTDYSPNGMFVTLSENFAKNDTNGDEYVSAEEAQAVIQAKHPDYKYIEIDKLKGKGIKIQTIKEIEAGGFNAFKIDENGKKVFYRDNSPSYSGNIPFTALLEDV